MVRRRTVVVLVVIAGVVAALAALGWQNMTLPRYHLGTKEELVSKLSEYFDREPNIGVKIMNETIRVDVGQVYRYDLVANSDKQSHGWMELRPNQGRVQDIVLVWIHNSDQKLLDSGYLMLSGVADITIPDWQNDDGDPNRNLEMLRLIKTNSDPDPSEDTYENWDLKERRVWVSTTDPQKTVVTVFIEP